MQITHVNHNNKTVEITVAYANGATDCISVRALPLGRLIVEAENDQQEGISFTLEDDGFTAVLNPEVLSLSKANPRPKLEPKQEGGLPSRRFHCYDIKWDIEDEAQGLSLPESDTVTLHILADVSVTDDIVEELLRDEISDKHGFSHKGFSFVELH